MTNDSSNKPIISISCITFNHESFVRECLDGFFMQQTEYPFEILIYDDASTDKTADIIREYKAKYPDIIHAILQTENQWSKGVRGIASRFNFSRARGKYIAMCEGDDYWTDPLKLQKQVDFLEANEDYVLVHHNAIAIDEKGRIIEKSVLPKKKLKDYSQKELSRGPHILTLSLCFRSIAFKPPKEVYEVFNGDTFIFSILGNFGKAKYDSSIKPAAYRKHSGGIWSLNSPVKKFNNFIHSFHVFSKYYYRQGNIELGDYFNFKSLIAAKNLSLYYLVLRDYEMAAATLEEHDFSDEEYEEISQIVEIFQQPKLLFLYSLMRYPILILKHSTKIMLRAIIKKIYEDSWSISH